MAIPTYDAFIAPLLRLLAEHPNGIRTRDAYDAIASTVGLSPEDRSERLPSGAQPVYQNRIAWAHDRLKRAGYSQSIQRGQWQLTDAGKRLLATHPAGLPQATVDAIALVPKISNAGIAAVGASTAAIADARSPEERIENALNELNESLARDLLAMAGASSPSFFERLVLDLLLAMGYGVTHADLHQVGGPGDGGIDGIVALDRLGLEKVYVQAKRWKGTVGRPEIQGFFGALAGRRARKGVFITTANFTKEAREYAQTVSDSIVLVDGTTLGALMIEYGVGVSHKPMRVARLDGDYFEDA